MTKIEKFNEMKRNVARVKDNVEKALGKDSPRNDKHSLYVCYTGKHEDWGDAVFKLHASYGYYGSSDGYRAMDKETAQYFEKAINRYINEIACTAVKLADEDLKKVAQEAKEEAQAVFAELPE